MLNKHIPRIGLGMFIVIATLFFYSALNAETKKQTNEEFRQKLESVITEEKEEEESPQELDSYIRYIPSRGVNALSGKVAIIAASSEYSYALKAFGKLPVEFSLDTQYIGIENTTGVELPAHLIGLSSGIETTLPFFKFNQTYLRVKVSPSFYGDDWNFSASNFRIPMHSFLIYRPNDKWTYILGAAVYPDFETKVWPILGFIYKANDKLTFNIVPERPNISYLLNDRVTLFVEGDSSYCEFEVDKDNLKNVVLSYKEIHLGTGIKYKFNKFIQTSISAGGIFNRSLRYRDSLGKVDIKDSIYTEFRVEINL